MLARRSSRNQGMLLLNQVVVIDLDPAVTTTTTSDKHKLESFFYQRI
jgi:hypothetical protein